MSKSKARKMADLFAGLGSDRSLSKNDFSDAHYNKLSAVEAGATADQTKADIDALNIDAHTLDGQQGSYYTGYADTAVANLVDSSPSTLDTLNELAAALGDDPNFATTVSTSIGTKLPLTGGAMTGAITTNSTFDGVDVGQLKTDFDNLSTDIIGDTSPQLGGALDVNGHSISFGDNEKARFGNADDLEIRHNGTHSFITNTTGNMYLQDDNYVEIGSSSGEVYIGARKDGAVNLRYDNVNKIETTSSGVSVTGNVAVSGTVDGRDVASDGNKLDGIESNANYITNNNQLTNGAGYITSFTNTTYSAGGGLGLSGTTFSVDADLRGLVTQIGRDSNDYYLVGSTTHKWFLDGNEDMRLENDGDLHVDGNVVAYSTTTSDERLKKDIVKIDNALDKVSQLNGYTFEYLNDGKKSAGILAQEVEAVLPSAVSEMKLPLKSDDDQEYKVVQYDQLHGLLIEAIKELKAEIEVLKGK